MIELSVYAKLAIPTRANVILTVQAVFELSGPTADGASEDSNYLRIRVLKTRLQQHLVESVYENRRSYEKIGEKLC